MLMIYHPVVISFFVKFVVLFFTEKRIVYKDFRYIEQEHR